MSFELLTTPNVIVVYKLLAQSFNNLIFNLIFKFFILQLNPCSLKTFSARAIVRTLLVCIDGRHNKRSLHTHVCFCVCTCVCVLWCCEVSLSLSITHILPSLSHPQLCHAGWRLGLSAWGRDWSDSPDSRPTSPTTGDSCIFCYYTLMGGCQNLST